jgi:hypothetical protein
MNDSGEAEAKEIGDGIRRTSYIWTKYIYNHTNKGVLAIL